MDTDNKQTSNTSASEEKRYIMFALPNLPVLFYCLREEFEKLPQALGVMRLIDEPKYEWYVEGYAAEFGLPLVQWTVRQV